MEDEKKEGWRRKKSLSGRQGFMWVRERWGRVYLLHEKTVPENKKKDRQKEIWQGERGNERGRERRREIFFSLDGSMLVEKKISWVGFCVSLSLYPPLVTLQSHTECHRHTEAFHYSTRCHENPTCPVRNMKKNKITPKSLESYPKIKF